MRDYTQKIENQRLDKGARKDLLIEMIGREIGRRNLKTAELRGIVPSISARQISDIRQGLRTAGSIERLEQLARGLGLPVDDTEPAELAA